MCGIRIFIKNQTSQIDISQQANRRMFQVSYINSRQVKYLGQVAYKKKQEINKVVPVLN